MGLKPEKFWQERQESNLQLIFGCLKRGLFAGKTIINRFLVSSGHFGYAEIPEVLFQDPLLNLAGARGIEPPTNGFGDRYSTS